MDLLLETHKVPSRLSPRLAGNERTLLFGGISLKSYSVWGPFAHLMRLATLGRDISKFERPRVRWLTSERSGANKPDSGAVFL